MSNRILSAALAALRDEYSYSPWEGETQLPPRLAAWRLADTADCAAPANDDTAGNQFLTGLFTDFEDMIERQVVPDAEADAYDIRREIERFTDNGYLHETADSAVPVYNGEKWQTFTQLGAWDEDVSDLVSGHGSRLTGDDIANAALYLIADRLLRALCDELADKCDEVEAAQAEASEEQAQA